jgi:hypothetical protein
MSRFSTLLFVIVVLAVMTGGTNAQIQNVLLEQHTGTWCGWCPDGTVRMDEILSLYGNQVIGAKVHNGDAMVIPEQSIIAKALGLTFYPTGSVNRKNVGGAVFLNRGDWKTVCQAQTQQRARAEVDCFYTLDKPTRVVKIQVVANITEPMDFPLRFNAFIMEDDVTGTGSGYDQKNYYSALPGYAGHPYYNQPPVLIGYHHMKVVRRMLGGAWGVPGNLPASVKAGELYSHQFEATLDGTWNMDKLRFVGMLQADAPDNKEIVNSAIPIENGALLNRIIDSNAPATQVLAAGAALVETYTLENKTDKEQRYTVTLSRTERTPEDWSVQFACGALTLASSDANEAFGEIVVPASGTAVLSLTLKAGSVLGIGDAKVMLKLKGTPTITRSRIVTGLAGAIKYLLLETGSAYSLRPYLSSTPYASAVTLDPADYSTFAAGLTNVKLVIWNKGASGSFSAKEMAAIKNAGTARMLLCGDHVIETLSSGDLSYFGLQWIGWNLEGQNTGIVRLCGQPGDVITGNLGTNITGNLIAYLLNMVKITDTANVFPILRFQNDGLRTTGGNLAYWTLAQDTIIGVRTTRNNTRTVLLGITPYVIAQDSIRKVLVSNILGWLAQ